VSSSTSEKLIQPAVISLARDHIIPAGTPSLGGRVKFSTAIEARWRERGGTDPSTADAVPKQAAMRVLTNLALPLVKLVHGAGAIPKAAAPVSHRR
jgi:hypothetical protein